MSIGTGPRKSTRQNPTPYPVLTRPEHRLPPYVQILVTHTRLSIYSSVINHPTAPTEVRHFFHAAGLSSALNVMRAAIQGENQLSSMPNNTAIMISFAACFALRLSSQLAGNSNLAPSVRALIEETADVLERIGCVTSHRNGMSALYGKYLKYIVKKAACPSSAERPPPPPEPIAQQQQQQRPIFSRTAAAAAQQAAQAAGYGMPEAMARANNNPPFLGGSPVWSEPIQFSSMSDDQVVEALSRVNNEFDPAVSMYPPWDDPAALDWMSWSNLPEFGV